MRHDSHAIRHVVDWSRAVLRRVFGHSLGCFGHSISPPAKTESGPVTPEMITQLVTQFGIAGLIAAGLWKAAVAVAAYLVPRIDRVVDVHVDLVNSLKNSEGSRLQNEAKQTALMQTLSENQQELIETHRTSVQKLSDDHDVIIKVLLKGE